MSSPTKSNPADRPPMRRLVYIVDWLPPDYGAIGQYALQEAEERARAGEIVLLVGLSSAPSSVERRKLGLGTLELRRLRSTPVPRSSLKARALWTLQTNLRLVTAAVRELRSADEVLFTASPPFLEHVLAPLRPLMRGELVFRIADLHPECLMAELERVPRWLEGFRALSSFHRRGVDRLEVLGEDQRARVLADGVQPSRVTLRRSVSPVAIDASTRPLPRPAELGDHVVLLYSGAVGHAHDFATFVEGYRRHHEQGGRRVALWLNATGENADDFEQAVRTLGLPIHRSKTVPLEELASLLVTPDAHLITLKDEFTGLVVPSKVYGCLASAKPVLFVGSSACDVHLLCSSELPTGSYHRADVGDPGAVHVALDALARSTSSESSH